MVKYDENVIPQCIKDALEHEKKNEEARPFQYSATVLCKTPRQAQLEIRHKSELEEPGIIDMWYAFAGSSMHDYLERHLRENPKYLVEQRIVRNDKPADMDDSCIRSVGAKFDAYDKESKTLYDHKTTTTFIWGKEMKPEWVKQLMINAYFLENEGFPVDKVAINAIYMDWRDSRLRYAKPDSYPPAPSTAFEMDAWPMKDREYLYHSLLKEHIEAEAISDDDLPFCDKEYCWESPAKFAVFRPGGKAAIRLVDTYQDALDYIKWKGLSGVEIEERPTTRRRCEKYCRVNKFCNQYQKWLDKNNKELSNE